MTTSMTILDRIIGIPVRLGLESVSGIDWNACPTSLESAPGLYDLCREDAMLPTTWSEAKPVRLVTARTILLAAMARFCDDLPLALSLIRGAGGSARYSVERWFSGLRPHSQESIRLSRNRGADPFQELQHIVEKSPQRFRD